MRTLTIINNISLQLNRTNACRWASDENEADSRWVWHTRMNTNACECSPFVTKLAIASNSYSWNRKLIMHKWICAHKHRWERERGHLQSVARILEGGKGGDRNFRMVLNVAVWNSWGSTRPVWRDTRPDHATLIVCSCCDIELVFQGVNTMKILLT